MLVADPSRIKKDVITKVTNTINDLAGVIDCSIVSAELNDRQAEGALCIRFFKSYFTDQVTQIVFVEAVCVNASDKPIGVSSRFQIHRRRASLQKRAMVVGFVIVSIKQNQVAGRENGVKDHFIGSGGSV